MLIIRDLKLITSLLLWSWCFSISGDNNEITNRYEREKSIGNLE